MLPIWFSSTIRYWKEELLSSSPKTPHCALSSVGNCGYHSAASVDRSSECSLPRVLYSSDRFHHPIPTSNRLYWAREIRQVLKECNADCWLEHWQSNEDHCYAWWLLCERSGDCSQARACYCFGNGHTRVIRSWYDNLRGAKWLFECSNLRHVSSMAMRNETKKFNTFGMRKLR